MTIHRSVDAAVNRSGGKPRLDGRFALAVDYRCWGMNEFRIIRLLVGCHLAVSVVTPGIIVALRDHSTEVNSAVWTRGVIVVAGALLTFGFAARAGRGHRRSYLRLRIVAVVVPVAIVAISVAPGMFPVWMKIDQAICGAFLVGVAVLANRGSVRSLFA